MIDLGDRAEDSVIDFKWYTTDKEGGAVTYSGGSIVVYKSNDTTEVTTGVTNTKDFDSKTGLHHCRIDLSDSWYAVNTDYEVVASGITVDGETINAVIATFSIEKRFNEVDVTKWSGSAVATPSVAGVPKVDVTHVGGAAEDISTETKQDIIDTNVDTLLSRLTALRAGYLDELDFDLNARLGTPVGASISVDINTLLTRLTAARAGYLDELDFGLSERLGTPAGASLAADIAENQTDLNTLLSRLTATRAGYLDELDFDLQNSIDTIDSNVDTIVGKLPSGNIASETDVQSIQNNTRFVSSIPATAVIPDTGSLIYKVSGYFYDTSGNMEDPDGAVVDSGTTTSAATNKLIETGQNFLTTVKPGMRVDNTTDTTEATVISVDSDIQLTLDADIMASGENYNIVEPELAVQVRRIQGASYLGTSELFEDYGATDPADASSTFTPSYYKMVREGIGRFAIYVKLASTESPDQWLADFACNENSVELHYTRTTHIYDENPGSVTLADNTTNADIIAESLKERDVSGVSPVSGSIYKDIMDNVDDVDTDLASLQSDVTAIKAVTDNNNGGIIDCNLMEINDDSVVGNLATLTLKHFNVQNDAGDAILAQSLGGNGNGIKSVGYGNGDGAYFLGGPDSGGHGITASATGSGNGAGLWLGGKGSSPALFGIGGVSGNGASFLAGASSDEPIGAGIFAKGDYLDGGSGIVAKGMLSGHGMQFVKGTTGKDIDADEIDQILADTNELQTDWTNGGRLDLILDDILLDTGTTLPATLSTIEGKIDTIDGNVDDIETLLGTVDGKVDTIDTNVDTLLARLTAARAGYLDELDFDLQGALGVIDGNVDDIETLLGTVNGKIDVIDGNVDDVESLLGVVNGKVDVIDGIVDTINTTTVAIKTKTDNLPPRLKKNTAYSNFHFVMIDSSNHIEPEPGLTVTATRSIDNGAFAACANSPVEIGGGLYRIDFAASDLNGNTITFKFVATGADDRLVTIVTNL